MLEIKNVLIRWKTDPRCPLGQMGSFTCSGLFNTAAVYCVFKFVRVVGSSLSGADGT